MGDVDVVGDGDVFVVVCGGGFYRRRVRFRARIDDIVV